MDSTYKVNIENYVLYVFLCQDSNLNGIPVACCYMRNETNTNMRFMYESFSERYETDKVEMIMVDKDLQNIDLIPESFPSAKILICTFHVIKYIRTY
ncbi:MAG: transposase, partial [bacterium]